MDVLLQERSLDLWNFIGRTVETNNQVKITKRIKMGSLLKAMTATIQEEDIDLVVLELRKRSFPNLGSFETHQNDPEPALPCAVGSPVAHPRHEPRKPLLWFQPAAGETDRVENLLSPDKAGDPGRGFRHRLIQSLIVGPAGTLEQVEGMVTTLNDKKLDLFAETSAKRFQKFEIGQSIPGSLQE